MYWQYGNYRHPDNEVSVTSFRLTSRRSARGKVISYIATLNIAGDMVNGGGTQAELSQRMREMIAAYNLDYRDAGLYQDDGTPTPIFLDSQDQYNISGNIVNVKHFPCADPGSWASHIPFQFQIQAEIYALASQFIDHQETIEYRGNCGPEYQWFERQVGTPYFLQSRTHTLQRIIHSGRAVGFGAYPFPTQPLLGYPFLSSRNTRIRYTGPKSHGQRFSGYTTSWSYLYTSPIQRSLLPPIFPGV